MAQDSTTTTADRVEPSTRAAQIESARQQKAASLEPDKPQGVEHALEVFEEKEVILRFTKGIAGFRVHLGGLVTGSGFAFRRLAVSNTRPSTPGRGATIIPTRRLSCTTPATHFGARRR
jgi:hypothetical protein